MDADTLEALEGSITKWRRIAAGTKVDLGNEDCPLCVLFLKLTDDAWTCAGCPVSASTGLIGCRGTPYIDWCNEMGQIEEGGEDPPWSATTPELVALACAELEFLESLRPVTP